MKWSIISKLRLGGLTGLGMVFVTGGTAAVLNETGLGQFVTAETVVGTVAGLVATWVPAYLKRQTIEDTNRGLPPH